METYEQKLKLAKEALESGSYDKETIEYIFPELKESEDERIRKVLIKLLKVPRNAIFEAEGITKEQALAWIEKQKEQKPLEYLPKEKINAILGKLTDLSYSKLIPFKSRESQKIDEISTDILGLLDYPIEKKQEQKPEWSKEDEDMRNLLIKVLEVNHPNGYFKANAINTLDMRAVYTEELVAWLKSLHPQVKKELSIEKAIKWLDDTFYFLDNSSGRGRDCEITTHAFDSLKEMYDSFRKAVIVDSEPHWKPSKEQIAALKEVINQDLNVCCGDVEWVTESLENLLEDLKKL